MSIQTNCRDCADRKKCQVSKKNCPYLGEFKREKVTPKKSRKRPITQEEIDKFAKLYTEGYLQTEIAEKTGRSVYVINKYSQRSEFYTPKIKTDWTQYDDRIIALREQGRTCHEIAKELDIADYKIRNRVKILKKRNLLKQTDDRKNEKFYERSRRWKNL